MNAPLSVSLSDTPDDPDAYDPFDPFGDDVEEADEDDIWGERPSPPMITPRLQRYCHRCSLPFLLASREDGRTCSGACRSAVHRKALTLAPTFVVIARLIEGAGPPPGVLLPREWNLLAGLLDCPLVPGRCAACSLPMPPGSRRDARTCLGACRSAIQDRAATLAPFLVLVRRLVSGDLPARGVRPPEWWGLVVRLLQRQRAVARVEVIARRLPGGAR
jgi:hypothetical protein